MNFRQRIIHHIPRGSSGRSSSSVVLVDPDTLGSSPLLINELVDGLLSGTSGDKCVEICELEDDDGSSVLVAGSSEGWPRSPLGTNVGADRESPFFAVRRPPDRRPFGLNIGERRVVVDERVASKAECDGTCRVGHTHAPRLSRLIIHF